MVRRFAVPAILCAWCVLAGAHPLPAPATGGSVHAHQKRVVLDNYYNNEWHSDSAGISVRYHYLWQDTANSGFSILGGIIAGLDAHTDTLCRRPDPKNLRDADVYVIVDPDTPKESDHPMAIDTAAARDVASWVHGGGVLVLLGNDKGNADLQGLSLLSSHFGIRFNEDSRNRVVGKDYQTGTFEQLPSHPLFRGVRKVYLKEISTLVVKSPARPLLTECTDVVMASAQYGKGLVFAVGDPWLYNEYIDGRKLPDGYDNALAAKNLFQWLLSNAHRHP